MKNKTNYGTIGVFLVLLVAFFYIGVLAPKDEAAAERENRELAAMPKVTAKNIFSGTFSVDFENYLSDNVGYRTFFMDASSKITAAKGIQSKSGSLVTANKDLGTGVAGDNTIWIYDGKIMEVYKKDDSARDGYVQMLNGYAQALPQNVRLFSFLAPTQIEFNDKNNLADSEKETIDYIYQNMDSRITGVPVYQNLEKHTNEYIYFRTDHHWTQRGAFYGYQAFVKAANGKTAKLSDYKIQSRDGFLGYLYNQVNDLSLKKHADTIEWLDFGKNYDVTAHYVENGQTGTYAAKMYAVPMSSEQPKYSLFMGGDHPMAIIQTDNQNGKTLLVLKDSYANALLPLLTRDYQTVIAVDPRSYFGKVTELVNQYSVDDVLIVNYVFTTTFADFIGSMNNIR